ncbi:phospholipid-transporting ATPase IC isoform X1 [Prionailurus iriomotensis]
MGLRTAREGHVRRLERQSPGTGQRSGHRPGCWCDLGPSPRSPTSMGSLAYREDLEEEKNSAFTWELEANSRDYNSQFKEKSFLCWQRRKYKSNVIHTAKYNVFSFLPLNLYEQFHRVSNLYFLFIIILQVWRGQPPARIASSREPSLTTLCPTAL